MVKRAFGLVCLSALLASGPAFASGAEEVYPWTLDQSGGTRAEQAAFYDGNLGVLMGGSPGPRLFATWRMLHNLPVGHEIGASLAAPCCEPPPEHLADATKAWLAARQQIDGVEPINDLSTDRDIGDFYGSPNCFADAFDTAVKTLADRIARYGKTDGSVRSWLDGQDTVFSECSKDAAMPPLPADAPDWLKQDRAYQEAAQSLYRRDFDDAAARFTAIARDPSSPWAGLAPYLAVRAAVHGAIHAKSAEGYAKARAELTELNAAGGYGKDELPKLDGMLEFRAAPVERRARLAASLTAPALPATAAADFEDLRQLDRDPLSRPEFLDWILMFGASAHDGMLERWRQGKDIAWLLAALAGTEPSDKEASELVEAARAVAPESPAYLTAAFQRIRLTAAIDDPAALRQELDAILARSDLSNTTRNLFLAERIQFAEDLMHFAALVPRQPGCAGADTTCDPGLRLPADLSPDVSALIDRMALATRAALAHSPGLSDGVRLDIALTSWVRAVLAQDDAVADRLAADLETLLPPLAADWQRFLDSKPGKDKRFAAYFILAKIPGADTGLSGDGYTRPKGDIADFQGHWHDWQFYPADRSAPAVDPRVENPDPVCQDLCGTGGFPLHSPDFIAAGADKAAAERARFAPAALDQPGMVDIWEEVLAYAKAHPKDPHAPEALYWLVRISRFGTGHNHSSHRAFDLLMSRYPDSDWAAKTKYYYD